MIGGAAMFALALPKAKRIYLTEVDAEPEGDAASPPSTKAPGPKSAGNAIPPAPPTTTPSCFECSSAAED